MQGRNIPHGTAVPEVMYMKVIQFAKKISMFMVLKELPFVMNILSTVDCPSNIKVASLLYYPSGQLNCLTSMLAVMIASSVSGVMQ